jgi:hypothetical protein
MHGDVHFNRQSAVIVKALEHSLTVNSLLCSQPDGESEKIFLQNKPHFLLLRAPRSESQMGVVQ